MTRRPVYIAAPYAAPTRDGRAWNIARAALLAHIAIADGAAPIVVHPTIPAVFGDDDDPAMRAVGLDCDRAIVGLVARHSAGELWVLLRDDGTPSSGMVDEWGAWCATRHMPTVPVQRHRGRGVRVGTWGDWLGSARSVGLHGKHARLVTPPGPMAFFEEWHARRTADAAEPGR